MVNEEAPILFLLKKVGIEAEVWMGIIDLSFLTIQDENSSIEMPI